MTIITEILNGQHDDVLGDITRAVRQREKIAAQIRTATLNPGDKVRLTGNLSPKYLVGSTGIVLRTLQSTVEVLLDDETIKRRAARYVDPSTGAIRAPAVCMVTL